MYSGWTHRIMHHSSDSAVGHPFGAQAFTMRASQTAGSEGTATHCILAFSGSSTRPFCLLFAALPGAICHPPGWDLRALQGRGGGAGKAVGYEQAQGVGVGGEMDKPGPSGTGEGAGGQQRQTPLPLEGNGATVHFCIHIWSCAQLPLN